jgi:hypothetical protein
MKDIRIFPDNSWQKLHLTPDKIQKVLVLTISIFLIFQELVFVEESYFRLIFGNSN